ncbi:hypothetical protein D1007_29682 [Hordeum vulgare]|nr:hypothetical protein D1007_29682 [Hordeum vulgare]
MSPSFSYLSSRKRSEEGLHIVADMGSMIGFRRALRVYGPCSSPGRRCGLPVHIGCGSAPRRISEPEIPTGMGAKVEVESYKPRHCAMGDLHASANGWRFPYEEETLNGFLTEEADVYSEYDKEMFRRTMLAHEAVFRQQLDNNSLDVQVYELHRVYRVQRDLMKQHQSREMHACSTLEDASQRNSPSQIPAHGANMIGTAPLNNEKSHSSKFPREGSVQSSLNGFPSSEATLPTKQGRFDLELGAEHYIEDDHASDSKPVYRTQQRCTYSGMFPTYPSPPLLLPTLM